MESRAAAAADACESAELFVYRGGVRRFRGGGGPGFVVVRQPATNWANESYSRGNAGDTIGHAAGDVVLQTIADRLLVATRTADTVARLGADEFLIVSEQTPDAAAVDRCTHR